MKTLRKNMSEVNNEIHKMVNDSVEKLLDDIGSDTERLRELVYSEQYDFSREFVINACKTKDHAILAYYSKDRDKCDMVKDIIMDEEITTYNIAMAQKNCIMHDLDYWCMSTSHIFNRFSISLSNESSSYYIQTNEVQSGGVTIDWHYKFTDEGKKYIIGQLDEYIELSSILYKLEYVSKS